MTPPDTAIPIFPLEDAVHVITQHAWRLAVERVPLPGALHRVLADDAASDVDMPPFNKASMDGYACRRADAFGPLRVVECIAAGATPTRALEPGECAKIMTGAPVPEGADCILIVEHVEETGMDCVRFTGDAVSSHIVPKGEDVRAGDVLLPRGRWLQPQDLAVLAATGHAQPAVFAKPRIGIVATGDELVPPEQTPGSAQIRNSNSYQLEALVRALGAQPTNYGIVRDDAELITAALMRAVLENDAVLTSGGVSMGDFDLVPGLLDGLGFTTHLRRIAIQPGKPMVFATRREKAFFGLSGNPVSSFIQFELLVKPFLFALQGAVAPVLEVCLPLAKTMKRRAADRMGWVPVLVREGRIMPIEFHGSAHLHALSLADGLVHFPVGCEELPAGVPIAMRWCRWG